MKLIAWVAALSLCISAPVIARGADVPSASKLPMGKEAAKGDVTRDQRLVLARRYFGALHFEKMMDGMMQSMVPEMLRQETSRYPSVSPEIRKAIQDSIIETMRDITPKVADEYIALMSRTFSEDELQKLVDFYESAVGQSIVAKTADLTQQAGPMMRSISGDIEREMTVRLCTKIDCHKLPKPSDVHPS